VKSVFKNSDGNFEEAVIKFYGQKIFNCWERVREASESVELLRENEFGAFG
jgi:hypothetical protein